MNYQEAYYIAVDGEGLTEIELGSTDIFDHFGGTICKDLGHSMEEYVIDDAFITEHDWFVDIDDFEKIDAYRRAMYGQWQHAFDNWQEAYVGQYASEADFSECMNEDCLSGLPNHIKSHIDWQGVWDSTDRHSYFESDGFYFMNL